MKNMRTLKMELEKMKEEKKIKRKQLNNYRFQRSEKQNGTILNGHRSNNETKLNKCPIEIGSVNWV